MRSLILIALLCGSVEAQQIVYGGQYYSQPVCNSPRCSMCNYIRNELYRAKLTAQQQTVARQMNQRRTNSYREQLKHKTTVVRPNVVRTVETTVIEPKAKVQKTEDPGTRPLNREVMTDALASLRLGMVDVFCDIGCGDGRVLIAATSRYRCRSVGIEIDPMIAEQARKHVAEAEMRKIVPKGYITILTGDATEFNPKRYGITAGLAYLFPSTLSQVHDTLTKIPILAIPFHELIGEEPTEEYKDVRIYRFD